MTVRPGVNVLTRTTTPAAGLPVDTGTWFTVGLADEGPAGVPTLVRSLGDFTRIFGPRVSYSAMYDAMETFFRELGAAAYFIRVVGPAATKATVSLNDRAVSPLPTLKVDAVGPGTYGATISVAVVAGSTANTFVLQVSRGGVILETSPNLSTPTDAVAWAAASAYIRVTDLASATAAPNNIPAVVAATPLTGGTDDRASVTDTVKVAALDLFPASLGPGQVSIPGGTTTTVHLGLRAHARAKNRQAVLDAPDTATVGTLTGLNTGVNDEYGATFSPWLVVPGYVPNTTRVVPMSAFVAAKMAATDAAFGPNEPAAGHNGRAVWAIGVSQTYDQASRQTLNEAGINVVRLIGNTPTIYGYRTNADPNIATDWLGLNNQRLRMAITAEAFDIGEVYEFRQIDGRGHLFAEVGGAMAGRMLDHYKRGEVYGSTPDEAYAVDTGPTVNTPVTIGNDELHILVSAKMSPFAEMVVFEITKVGITGLV